MTEREVKLPNFKFNVQKNKCLQVSLSGREALAAIADKHELSATAKVQPELFDGVFGAEQLLPCSDYEIDCMRVLKTMQPLLFAHKHPPRPSGPSGISSKDAAEL